MKILSIETSCDETAASILEVDLHSKQPDFKILSNVVRSQIKLHAKWGGVVPEIAARAHLAAITPVVTEALKKARVSLTEIDYIAPTTGPGLIASLLVGTEFAKALSYGSGIPIIPINHMEGHMYSALAEYRNKEIGNRKQKMQYPMISLIVSGGHTMLVLLKSESKYTVIGSTVDDAAGEAFDKVAKLLNLPYPGGPIISKLAEKGEPTIDFPRPMIHAKNYDFSFSGLKTAVRYHLRDNPKTKKEDLARSFEDAAIEVLITKTLRAAKQYKCKSISLTGGVSANKKLRDTLREMSKKENLDFLVPPFELCTDNAAMIGIAAYINLRARKKPIKPEKIKADNTWEIS